MVRVLAAFLFAFAGGIAAASGKGAVEKPNCPEYSFEEIRSSYKPKPAQPGVAVIDRTLFWDRMEKISDANEVFKYKAKKKDKTTGVVSLVEKEVSFNKSVVDSEHKAVIEAVFDRWEATGGGHPKYLALMLGTAYRETCGRLLSTVGEACGCSRTCNKDEQDRKSVV